MGWLGCMPSQRLICPTAPSVMNSPSHLGESSASFFRSSYFQLRQAQKHLQTLREKEGASAAVLAAAEAQVQVLPQF